MNTLKLFLLLFAITVCIISCKKDKQGVTPLPGQSAAYPNYTQLKVGNYWIYQRFTVDSLGNATSANEIDSCYMEKDTVINGTVYFKMYHPDPYSIPLSEYWIVRDSLHYMVDLTGCILFSSQDFNTIFYDYYYLATTDTVAHLTVRMDDTQVVVNVPAGSWQTINYKRTYEMYGTWTMNGSIRYRHTRYAKDLGIVTETLPFYAAVPTYVERRLIRYHLN